MVEPDCNEEEAKGLKEPQNVTSSDKISNKRIREETSDSEKDLPLKKARIDKLPIEEESNSTKTDNSHSNNDVNEVVEIDQSKDASNHSNSNDMDDKKDEKCSTTDDVEAIKSNITEENVAGEKKVEDIQENEKDTIKVSDGESDKDDSSLEKPRERKDQSTGDNELEKETKKQKNRKKNEQSEIINGVELTVECVSDGDSSEESEKEENSKPRPKTEIVREQPNDSEVDVSSSEAEKSDSYKIIEAKSKSNNEDTPTKQAKKRGRKKSSSKAAAASESESNTEDEDYSPVAKKKIKKSPDPKKTTEVKRGRGRPRGRPPKNAVKSIKEIPVDESGKKREASSVDAEKQNDKKSKSKEAKDSEKADSKTEDSVGEESDEKGDSESDESEDVKKGKRRKPSKRNIKKIEKLKKYIRAAGIKINNYSTLLKGCETDAAKAKRLAEFLHENGVVGRPTLEKCNKIRIKNETLKEIQELDTSSIISETRSTRGKNVRKTQNETIIETKSSSDQKASETYKRIQAVADSDSE